MTNIINTLAKYPVGWTWAQHKAAGKQGGTDYIVPGGTPIRSAVAGTVKYLGRMADGNYMVGITYAVGRSINYRELGSVPRTGSWKVKQNDIIGYADSVMWVHVDATILGIRRQFEPLVTKTTAPAEVNKPTPVNQKEIITMAAPLVFDYKASPTSNNWFRVWEFSIDETTDSATAVQWKTEAGQKDTYSADGNFLNFQRTAVRDRVTALATALKS